MKKRIILLTLSLSVIAFMTGCGNSSNSLNENNTESVSVTEKNVSVTEESIEVVTETTTESITDNKGDSEETKALSFE